MPAARAARGLRAAGRAALVVLAAALPFEGANPLTHLGPLQLSSVELPLYLVLALWGASVAAGFLAGERDLVGRIARLPRAHFAVAGFALALALSAAFAPALRAPAVKFALRSMSGMLLYAAAADLLRAPGAALRTARALVGAALVAAVLTLLEPRSVAVASWLHPFHERTFAALGAPRGSGPFQYPNIAAMYLEASVPIAVALGAAAWRRRRKSRSMLELLAITGLLALLAGGVLATASRAGLVGALGAMVILGLVVGRAPATRALLPATLAVALVLGLVAGSSALGGRFRFWQDGAWYRAAVVPAGGAAGRLPAVLAPGILATESLTVENQGGLLWPHASASPIALSYHWLDPATGKVAIFDGRRTWLPHDVPPGGRTELLAEVVAPRRPGRYVLWWDLVHEHTTWFSERGSPGLREAVLVGGGAAPASAALDPAPREFPLLTTREPDGVPRRTLWHGAVAAWRAHPLLGIGPDNFRHLAGQLLGRTDIDERLHANSLYFETLADLGMVGVLAFGAVLLALGAAARRAVGLFTRGFAMDGLATDGLAADGLATDGLIALGVVAALGTFLLHGVLDYFLEFTPTYGLFWLLAGMIVAMARTAPDPGAGARA
jgi:hypothetical protein